MSKVSLLIRFVFTTLLLVSTCMAQNSWYPSDKRRIQPVSGTSSELGSIPKSQLSIFENDTDNVQTLMRSLKDIIRFSIVYFLSLFTKLFPDRYQYLRNVADGINGVIDSFSYYYRLLFKIIRKVYAYFESIPILGFLVTVPASLIKSILYVPKEGILVIADAIKGVLL